MREGRYSWTQPVCADCWHAMHPDKEPAVLIAGETEQCCMCGTVTAAGIYLRINPELVAFPTLTK